MNDTNTYIFAYGSLMNPRSLARTLPGRKETSRARLHGYQRSMNIAFGEYAYLNIVPDATQSVDGVLIPVTADEFGAFIEREKGYTRIDVTSQLSEKIMGRAYAFIAPDIACTLKVPRSYILTCTSGMSEEASVRWIRETIMYGIEEDLENPVYEHAAY